jgi:hypothetical protein
VNFVIILQQTRLIVLFLLYRYEILEYTVLTYHFSGSDMRERWLNTVRPLRERQVRSERFALRNVTAGECVSRFSNSLCRGLAVGELRCHARSSLSVCRVLRESAYAGPLAF